MNNDYIYHYGIKNQKWGNRRYQYENGSLTPLGRVHYGVGKARSTAKKAYSSFNKNANRAYNMASFKLNNNYLKASREFGKQFNNLKIDALDIANRKGVLDFVDKFSSYIPSSREAYSSPTSSVSSPIDNYKSKSSDFRKGISNISRYTDYLNDDRYDYDHSKLIGRVRTALTSSPYQDALSDWAVDRTRSYLDAHGDDHSYDRKFTLNYYTNQMSESGNRDPEAHSTALREATNDFITKFTKLDKYRSDFDPNKMFDYSDSGVRFIDDYAYEYTKALRHNDEASDFLMHHGIKNQKWGVRRYQNPDGSLTALGRVHYGVGAARRGVDKAAGTAAKAVKKAGHAIRGKIAPTDQQLQEQFDKAKRKADRKAMKVEIKALKGKPKDIKDMSNQEVIDAINRYRNEHTLRALRKDANKSNTRLLIEEAGKKALADAIGATGKNILMNIGKALSNATDTKENKAAREKQYLQNLKDIEDLKNKEESYSDKLKKEASDLENARKAYKSRLDLEAMSGNEDAKERLSNYSNASKGKYERRASEDSTRDSDTAESDQSNDRESRRQRTEERNRQREQERSDFESGMNDRRQQRESEPRVTYETPSESTSSFIRNNGRGVVTDAVRGVDYEEVSDHIDSLNSRRTRSLPSARS